MRSSASSEVIACSMPGSSGRLGLAPTAIRMRSAVWVSPPASTASAAVTRPRALMSWTPAFSSMPM